MNHMYRTDAEACRRQASAYRGRPEELFLYRIAEAFDDLAERAQAIRPQPARA